MQVRVVPADKFRSRVGRVGCRHLEVFLVNVGNLVSSGAGDDLQVRRNGGSTFGSEPYGCHSGGGAVGTGHDPMLWAGRLGGRLIFHDNNGTAGPGGDVERNRAEQRPDNPAVSSAAQDEQSCAVARLDEGARRAGHLGRASNAQSGVCFEGLRDSALRDLLSGLQGSRIAVKQAWAGLAVMPG